MTQNPWSDEEFRKKWQEQADEMGRFNLAIFGKTGVGKSTLINAVFGREVAETGVGKPVTMEKHLYLHDSGFLGLLDTRGLEVGRDTEALVKELGTYMKTMRKQPRSEQIHVAWYCVRSMDRRFEDTEADFIRRIDELGLPVIVTLTQAPSRNGEPHPHVVDLANHIAQLDLPIVGGRPLPVMAEEDEFTNEIQHGLQDLLDATFRVAPDGVKVALAAAQKIDLAKKFKEAQQVVWAFAALAGAAGAITKSDPKALAAVQFWMTGKVAAIYGIDVEIAALAFGAATATVTKGGGNAIASLLKSMPDATRGTQGAISATVAASFTAAVGYAWAAVCGQLAQGNLRALNGLLDNELVRELFLSQFRVNIANKPKKSDSNLD